MRVFVIRFRSRTASLAGRRAKYWDLSLYRDGLSAQFSLGGFAVGSMGISGLPANRAVSAFCAFVKLAGAVPIR